MSTVTPLSAWNKGINVLIFSRGLPVAAIFNFAAARDWGRWGRFAAEDLAPVSQVHFPCALRGVRKRGGFQGVSSLKQHFWKKRQREHEAKQEEVSCWFSICLQMFRTECEVAADHCFHQVWIWADSLTHSPVCSKQVLPAFQQVLSLQDFSFLEEEVVWLFGHEEQLVLFPALTPVPELASQLWAENQTAEHTGATVTCTWLDVGVQAGELWCPPLDRKSVV